MAELFAAKKKKEGRVLLATETAHHGINWIAQFYALEWFFGIFASIGVYFILFLSTELNLVVSL